jgi:hypothetical protein
MSPEIFNGSWRVGTVTSDSLKKACRELWRLEIQCAFRTRDMLPAKSMNFGQVRQVRLTVRRQAHPAPCKWSVHLFIGNNVRGAGTSGQLQQKCLAQVQPSVKVRHIVCETDSHPSTRHVTLLPLISFLLCCSNPLIESLQITYVVSSPVPPIAVLWATAFSFTA